MKVASEILNLKPYVAGKPVEETMREFGLSRVVKLASNENPLGPSPKAVEVCQQRLALQHRYPDPAFWELREAYAATLQVSPREVTFGNGSNELIDLLIQLFCRPGDSVLTSQGAFIAYRISCQASCVPLLETPMDAALHFDLDQMAEVLMSPQGERIRLVFIANPNNPTGTYISVTSLTRFLEKARERSDCYVVLDEAYFEFVRASDYASGVNLRRQYPNVLVLRTFSKIYGLAGLRVGALVGPRDVVELIDRIRAPFNVNDLGQHAAFAALQDAEHIERSKKVVWQGLDRWCQALEMMGVRYWPSAGNFVLADIGREAGPVYQQLLKRGVILRPLANYGWPNYLRVSIGLPEENEMAINNLKEVLEQ